MENKYDKSNINPLIINYIESTIFPKYDLNEASHGINHIFNVINKSISISKNYDVNLDIVYVVASYHDIGHHIDKDNHEKISAQMMMEDEKLKEFFSADELNTIKEAIEDHRASSTQVPRNIYGKIISAADKNMNVTDAITRTYIYSKAHYPNLSETELLDEVYNHLEDKFGVNGYAKVYIKDEQFENFKKELIDLLNNKPKFFSKVNSVINDIKNS